MEQTSTQKYDWDFIMTDNDYNIAQKLLEIYKQKDFDELGKALEAYLTGSIQDAKLELYREMKILIETVLYSKYSEKHRTQENWEKIVHHRGEIEELFEDYDFLTEDSIQKEWNDAYNAAKEIVEIDFGEIEMQISYEEVFEKEY